MAVADQHNDYEDEFLEALDEIVALVAPIWRLGDGSGGWVIDQIEKRMEQTYSWYRRDRHTPTTTRTKVTIGGTLRRQVFERDLYRCQHCGTHLDLCADHIVPESKGGPTTFENLQTLCRSCNSKKGVS